jgi:uncharacterized membrane protein YraQ (UPF0718 family)
MGALSVPVPNRRLECYYRPLILAGWAVALFFAFWFGSRYPQLMSKARHVGEAVPSMTYSHEILSAAPSAAAWEKVLFGAVNWLDAMKIGMAFGVLLGALLHTVLRYYPLKIGRNLYVNSVKGALVGAPMGICANCSVPAACGLTRGHGRIEVALGFLFSSPNFNPVVVMMTLAAFPLAMTITKYAVLLLVIVVLVPGLIAWLERRETIKPFTAVDENASCELTLPADDCMETFWAVFKNLAGDYGRHVWMLGKPTITLMVFASVLSSAILTLVPWPSLLSQVTPMRAALVSLMSVFMPVPIALDVLFAAQLQAQRIASGYVMLFIMTLGTYSIIPAVYLWREVSKKLAATLFAFFFVVGWITALLF